MASQPAQGVFIAGATETRASSVRGGYVGVSHFQHIWELAQILWLRDLRTQFRQSWMGYFWLVIPPVAASMVWLWLQRQGVLVVSTGAVPYPLFALAGILLWEIFVQSLHAPLIVLNAALPLLSRIRLPLVSILLAGLGGVLVQAGIRVALLVLIALCTGSLAPLGILWCVPALLCLICLGFAVGLWLAPLGMLINDVIRALGTLISFWFFVTPVVYLLPPAANTWLLLNPVAEPLCSARAALLTGQFPTAGCWGWFAAGLIVLAGGYFWVIRSLPLVIRRLPS